MCLCSLARRYENPIPALFLAPTDCSKIPTQLRTFQKGSFYNVWSLSFPLSKDFNRFLQALNRVLTPKKTESGKFCKFWSLLLKRTVQCMLVPKSKSISPSRIFLKSWLCAHIQYCTVQYCIYICTVCSAFIYIG